VEHAAVGVAAHHVARVSPALGEAVGGVASARHRKDPELLHFVRCEGKVKNVKVFLLVSVHAAWVRYEQR
jgi:hypothetical protein